MFERGRTVGILLYDPGRDEVVLVEQFRLPRISPAWPPGRLEIVAGIVDAEDGASEIELARRETQEEAGLALDRRADIPRIASCPAPAPAPRSSISSAPRRFPHAGGIHGLAAEHEDIRVVVLTFDEAMRQVRADAIKNSPTLLALYWLAAERDRLRRDWRAQSSSAS